MTRLDCRRLVDYDPDNHEILIGTGGVNLQLVELEDGEMTVRIQFKAEVRAEDDGELWGTIEGEALTRITDDAISEDLIDDSGRFRLPTNLVKVLEGAFSEDMLLPVSHVAQAMRLPSMLVSPIDFSELIEDADVRAVVEQD